MNVKIPHALYIIILACTLWVSCSDTAKEKERNNWNPTKISEDSLLTLVQKRTFNYFWEGAEPHSGMAPERIHMNGKYPLNDKNVVTTGGSGFGIMAILVGIERGFITRSKGVQRLAKIVHFLEEADRFHGAWPHWLHGKTGKVKPFSKKDDGGDLVETSFLIQGLICARQYLRNGNKIEQKLAAKIDTLWRQIEWNWYTKNGKENVLYWHWSPDYGWAMNFELKGYNEALITYVLATSSPTHPISTEVYHKGWARSGDIKADVTTYGYELQLTHNGAKKYGGPLFWAHYSYLGLDPRDLVSPYANLWKENVNQTLINYTWCVKNPHNYEGYGKKSWGLTASYSVKGYASHAPGEKTSGVITPTAALSSFPYTPKKSMRALKHFYYDLGGKIWGKYGFYDAFSVEENWYPKKYLAIDQGPIVVMIENYRSGLLWELFMSAPEIQKGLKKLGFKSPYIN